MGFYDTDNEGIQSDEQAMEYARRHVAGGDPYGFGYDHCNWCGDEWPCTTASLLHLIEREN